jgi:hypothetical protein
MLCEIRGCANNIDEAGFEGQLGPIEMQVFRLVNFSKHDPDPPILFIGGVELWNVITFLFREDSELWYLLALQVGVRDGRSSYIWSSLRTPSTFGAWFDNVMVSQIGAFRAPSSPPRICGAL